MKLNPEQLKLILKQHPINWTEEETKEILPLIGLTAKEYYHHAAIKNPTRHFEVHHKRLYLFKVELDEGCSISISNEYIDFGDGLHGICFGGQDTVNAALLLIISMANRIDRSFTGQVNYPEESEYTEQEFEELVNTLSDIVFQNA